MQINANKKQPLTLSYDNLIIGSSLEAVLFAYQTSTPLISTRMERPYYFEEITDFGLGTNKLDIWNKYIFVLSLSGLAPFSDKVKHIRYVDANNIKVVTKEDKLFIIKFNRLFLFDDESFYDLPPHTGFTKKENLVIDWMKTVNSKKHQLEYIDNENKFINRILFHAVGKNYSNGPKKDCLVISYLTESQLYSEKYAEYVVRIKVENILKNNIAEQTSVEHLRRDIIKLGKNTYNDFDNIIFMDCEPEVAWNFGIPRSKINLQKYIKSKLSL